MNAPFDIPLHTSPKGVVLQVKVHPRARRNAIAGVVGEAIKLSVTAPADQGKANQAVLELLAEIFETPVADITIVSGLTSSRKVIRLDGLSEAAVRQRLQGIPEKGRR